MSDNTSPISVGSPVSTWPSYASRSPAALSAGASRRRRSAALVPAQPWCRASLRSSARSWSVRMLAISRGFGRRCTTALGRTTRSVADAPFPTLGRRGLNVAAMSGVDMALWDLLGKSLGAPVVDLWGGACRADMPLYASGGWADTAGIGAELNGYVARGFSAVKMRVGVMDGDVETSIARVEAARSALGPAVGLMVDAHGTFSAFRGETLRGGRRTVWGEVVRRARQRRRSPRRSGCSILDHHRDCRRGERVHPIRLPRPDRDRRRRRTATRSGDLRGPDRRPSDRRARRGIPVGARTALLGLGALVHCGDDSGVRQSRGNSDRVFARRKPISA